MRLELLVIDPEEGTLGAVESIGIDRVRALTEFVQLTSHRQRAKVAVIAPAERMNGAAANALLKTLEEPPPATYLILVSDQPGRMPATLRSRCRMLAAPVPERSDAIAWLATQGGRSAGTGACAGIGRAHCARWSRPIRSCRTSVGPWLAALAAPERLSVARLAARIDAGGKDERRARLAHMVGWLIAWTADLARIAAGRHRATQPRRRRIAAAPGRSGGADRIVSLSSLVASAASDAGASAATAPRGRDLAA
jgi:DNA polymerase-3 subunit delta'